MKIKNIDLIPLHNEEHFQFQTLFLNLVREHTALALKIDVPLQELYLPSYEKEDECLKLIFKSSFTPLLAEMDAARDRLARGLTLLVEAYSYHFDQDVAQAANRLQILLDTYGKIYEKPYDKETIAIYDLIQDLNGEYAADASRIGLEDWIRELDSCNGQFEELKKERALESTGKTGLRMKTVRKEIDAAYRTLIKCIDVLMIVEGEAAYLAFAKEHNIHIEHYKYLIVQRRGWVAARKNREENDSITNL